MTIKNYLLPFYVVLFTSLLSINAIDAQVSLWERPQSDLKWQQVTDLGTYLICSNQGLSALDTKTGNLIWNNPEIANLNLDFFEPIQGSPFLYARLKNKLLLIDQFTGKTIFDSSIAGINKIKIFFMLFNSDSILVAGINNDGEEMMVSVSMSDAQVKWSLEGDYGRVVAVNELDNNEILLVTLLNNYKINAKDGSLIWKNTTSKEAADLDKYGGLKDLIKTVANKIPEMTDINISFFSNPTEGVFYLGTEKENVIGQSSNGPITKYTSTYYAYSIKDGSLIWDKPLEIDGMLGFMIFKKDGFIVLPNNGDRTKINLFDYKTKEGKWGKKGKGIALKGGIYDYMESGDNLLIVSHKKTKNFLHYINAKTGTLNFDDPVKVDGQVAGMFPMTNSMLYITDTSMNVLDYNNGSLVWDKSIATSPDLTAEYNGKTYAFDFKSQTIKIVDNQTGTISDVHNEPVRFDGKETPTNMEVFEDGIVLFSEQNIAKVRFDGKILFNQYFEAPRERGFKRALLYAQSLSLALRSAQSYYISGALGKAQRDISKVSDDKVLIGQVGTYRDAYNHLGNVTSTYASSAFKMASARIKATKLGVDFIFIMSKKDNDIQLLKVNKSTGNIDHTISLGKNRQPEYAVDNITGQVFYFDDSKNKLVSY